MLLPNLIFPKNTVTFQVLAILFHSPLQNSQFIITSKMHILISPKSNEHIFHIFLLVQQTQGCISRFNFFPSFNKYVYFSYEVEFFSKVYLCFLLYKLLIKPLTICMFFINLSQFLTLSNLNFSLHIWKQILSTQSFNLF